MDLDIVYNASVEGELEQIRAENERLRAENKRLSSVAVECPECQRVLPYLHGNHHRANPDMVDPITRKREQSIAGLISLLLAVIILALVIWFALSA